ncbi:juvenile hormone esterase-like [Harmonia axyridis]|uniref:juvenile hormone esterase-like n=1 Tax=Harmonia axyridis TaxID=115357 RepID=UPI001E27606B|nr:juvenile hormone esterase-like [Harmonia axyridis]
MFFVSLLFFLLTIFSYTSSTNDAHINDNPIVETKNGLVLGAKFAVENTTFSYYGFQGIPFAEPPIGKRRFLPPESKKNWTGTLNATRDIPSCMQVAKPDSTMKLSEDCLVLNVYSPDLKGLYPVMFYIYGGAFIFGTASKRIYGPEHLIQENVVIVVTNYRLGIFGFLSTQDDVVPGNNGLRDQIMALEWVKENIRAFGGDPNRVTIFGESAGSASVSLLLQAKPAEGLFHGAIMESGVSLSLFARTRDPLDIAFSTAEGLNIIALTSKELVEKLRAVDANDLQKASTQSMFVAAVLENPLGGLFFSPCLEHHHKGAVLSEYNHEKLMKGGFAKVPVIVGFNSAEGNPFAIALKNHPLLGLRYDLDNALLIPPSMNVKNSHKTEVGSEIKKYYFGKRTITSSALHISKYITDDQFLRPTIEFVRLISAVTPTYLYEFSYVGSASIGTRELPGVGHAEDVKYLWNDGKPLDKKDQITSNKLVKLWTNFAKYRNPTPSRELILKEVIWQPSNSLNFSYLQIDKTLSMKYNPRINDVNFWYSIFDKYGNPPYDTY